MSGRTGEEYRWNCDECGAPLIYVELTTNNRGEAASLFKCTNDECEEDEVVRD